MAISIFRRFTFYCCCFGSKRKIWKCQLGSSAKKNCFYMNMFKNTLKKSAMEYVLDALVTTFPAGKFTQENFPGFCRKKIG